MLHNSKPVELQKQLREYGFEYVVTSNGQPKQNHLLYPEGYICCRYPQARNTITNLAN
jgi:hypothetical protein